MTPQAAEGAPEVTTLLDDDQVVIELHACTPPAKTLVITFDPLMYLWPCPAFGLEFLLRQEVDVVTVRKRSEDFYQGLDRVLFRRVVDPLLADDRPRLGRGLLVHQRDDGDRAGTERDLLLGDDGSRDRRGSGERRGRRQHAGQQQREGEQRGEAAHLA